MISPARLLHGFSKDEFDELIVRLADLQVSDITIETGKPIWVKLHGSQYKATERTIQDFEARAVVTWMYGGNAVGALTKGSPLNKRYEVLTGDSRRLPFRMNAVSCYTPRGSGISVTLRTIPLEVPRLEDMNLPEALENDKALMFPEKGIVLIVGETGSGKSTLLAAMNAYKLEKIPNRKIVTFEAPIEFDLQSVRSPASFISQREIGDHIPTFYEGIVEALRQGPTDILVGEAREQQTIAAMLAAAESGHATYSTVHAESVATTFLRIANEFPPDQISQVIYKIVSQARLIVVQRLAMPITPGRRVPIRSWLAFSDTFRRSLMRLPAIEAVSKIDEEVHRLGQSMGQQARLAFKAGLIDEPVLRTFVGDDIE